MAANCRPMAVYMFLLIGQIFVRAFPQQESVLLGDELASEERGFRTVEDAEGQARLGIPQPDCRTPFCCRRRCKDIYACQAWTYFFHGEDANCWLYQEPEEITCERKICRTGTMIKPSTTRTSTTTVATVTAAGFETTSTTTFTVTLNWDQWSMQTTSHGGYNYGYYSQNSIGGPPALGAAHLSMQIEAAAKAGQEEELKDLEKRMQEGNFSEEAQAELVSKKKAVDLEQRAEEILKGNATQAEKDAACALAAEAAAEAALKMLQLRPEDSAMMMEAYEALIAVRDAWRAFEEKQAKGASTAELEELRAKVMEAEADEATAKAAHELAVYGHDHECEDYYYCYEYYDSRALDTDELTAIEAQELMLAAMARGNTELAARYEGILKSAESTAGMSLARLKARGTPEEAVLSMQASEYAAELAKKMAEVAMSENKEELAAAQKLAEQKYREAQRATEEAIKSGEPAAIAKAHAAEAEAEDAAKKALAALSAQQYMDDPSRMDALDTARILTELEEKATETGLAKEDLLLEKDRLKRLKNKEKVYGEHQGKGKEHNPFYHHYYTYVDAAELCDKDVIFSNEAYSSAKRDGLPHLEKLLKRVNMSQDAAAAMHKLSKAQESFKEKGEDDPAKDTSALDADAAAVGAARAGLARAAADEDYARAERDNSQENATNASFDAKVAGQQLAAMSDWEAAAQAVKAARLALVNATEANENQVTALGAEAVTNITSQTEEVDHKRKQMFESAAKALKASVDAKESGAMLGYQEKLVDLADHAYDSAVEVSNDPSIEAHATAASTMSVYAEQQNSILKDLFANDAAAVREEITVKAQIGGLAKLEAAIKAAESESHGDEEVLEKIQEASIESVEAHAKHTAGRGAEDALRTGVLPKSRLTRAEVLNRLTTRFDAALHRLKEARVAVEEALSAGQDTDGPVQKERHEAVAAAHAGTTLFAVRVKIAFKHVTAKHTALHDYKEMMGNETDANSTEVADKEKEVAAVQVLARLTQEVHILMEEWLSAALGALREIHSHEKALVEESAADIAERAYADFLKSKHFVQRHAHYRAVIAGAANGTIADWSRQWPSLNGSWFNGTHHEAPWFRASGSTCMDKVQPIYGDVDAAAAKRDQHMKEASDAARKAAAERENAIDAQVDAVLNSSSTYAHAAALAMLKWHRAQLMAKEKSLIAAKTARHVAELRVTAETARANCSDASGSELRLRLAEEAVTALNSVVLEAQDSLETLQTAIATESAAHGEGSAEAMLAMAQLIGDMFGKKKVTVALSLAKFEAKEAQLEVLELESQEWNRTNRSVVQKQVLDDAKSQLKKAKATEEELSEALSNLTSGYSETVLAINTPNTYCAAFCAYNLGKVLPSSWSGACCKQAMDEFGDLISCAAQSARRSACKCARDDDRPFLVADHSEGEFKGARSGYVCGGAPETYLKYEGLRCPEAEVGSWPGLDLKSCKDLCDSSTQCQAIEINATSCRASSSCNGQIGVPSEYTTVYVKQVP
mmetsp:Transcript_43547/g.100260  ORF Transcript_43547/g.100260 Transcript_43547/m.100260 type:complete len:1500 (-) Transcript_43547:154-4653(-)